MRNLLAAAALALLPTLTAAKDAGGEFAVFSVGGQRCSDYLAAREQGGRSQERYSQWLQGYLSAFNLIVVDTYDIIGDRDYRQLLTWLDDYCRQQPSDSFVNASARLTVRLYPGRRDRSPADPPTRRPARTSPPPESVADARPLR